MKLQLGPGTLVAAAFIGPGTVTACTLAGANFGYALLWALMFATVATIILQDMAARLGAGAQLGLGETLMLNAPSKLFKWGAAGLVLAVLLIGNSAYEGGNLTGGALGLEAMAGTPEAQRPWLIAGLAALAALLVIIGKYETLERVLVGLVLVMSLAFIFSFITVRPDIGAMLTGLAPRIPDGGTLTAIALIGTTIVPYNLFLHAAASRKKWADGDVAAARRESGFSIGLGGFVSIMILSTAAASLFGSGLVIGNAADMARAVEPAAGEAARYLIGLGLLAAGLTSAITAPMATAFALSEIFGWSRGQNNLAFKAIALFVIAVGALISLSGLKPLTLILIAQYANGLLLPVVAVFLLIVMNRKDLLGAHANSLAANIAGGAVVLITFGIGLRSVLRAAGVMP